MKPPLVSVVIPVYNRGARLQPTIESALEQTLPSHDYEIIIVDDGSTDDTLAFLQLTYADEHRIKIVSQPNGGVARARNRGLEEARGEFSAYLDHDDFWLPNKLEKQLAAFEGKPAVGVIYCRWIDVDENRVPWPAERQITRLDWWDPATGSVYYWLIRRNSIVSMSLPLIRTSILRAVGGFDPETAPCDDWDLWLRLARRCHFEFVPQDLVLYTRHSGQQSENMETMGAATKKVMQKQWRFVLRKPRLLWFVATSVSFIDTLPLYREAKKHLFSAQRGHTLRTLGRVATYRPLALVSPQWVYLVKRLLMGNTTPY